MSMRYQDATLTAVDEAMENSVRAFEQYQKLNLAQRAAFLEDIGKALEENSGELILTAAAETNLETARLKAELARTVFQLRSYAKACAEGSWLDVRIDTPFLALSMAGDDGLKKPGAPDLRKMLVPLGPVVVFGASNFPFAYSTAGGDTACALAAGCTVVVKAHPAHAHTSELVAGIIDTAAKAGGLPEGIFIHLHGSGFEVGKALVEHRHTKAV
ncbi:MAG TPA: aldehyde dehydrogenase family protein, partial [Flavisolibacter sp.]|nr:aldehyde dehydrogenase family protein [Flavisolibacter sp.]